MEYLHAQKDTATSTTVAATNTNVGITTTADTTLIVVETLVETVIQPIAN